MRWTCRAVCIVGIAVAVLACWAGQVSADGQAGVWAYGDAGWAGAPPRQVPNLLRSIVEAVQRALRELEDSLRDELCGRCPATAGALVLASALMAGYDRARRK